MPKIQRRRSVSISSELYDRLKVYGEINEIPVSRLVEDHLRPIVKLPKYTKGTRWRPRAEPPT